VEKALDTYLSEIWNATMPNASKSTPEQMWAACRVLSDKGYITGDRQALGLAEIGPFKIATTMESRELLESLLHGGIPLIFKALCGGLTLYDAIEGVLASSFAAFSVVSSTSAKISEPSAWVLLTYLKNRNRAGLYPTPDEMAGYLVAKGVFDKEGEALAILERLKAANSVLSAGKVCLVMERSEGGLECRA
jgi:hypothetical protein